MVSRDQSVRGWVFRDQIVPLEQADQYFNRVVANDPRDAEAFWIHARFLYYRNDNERALANVNRAIRLEPDQARYYVTRALGTARQTASGSRPRGLRPGDQIDPRSRDLRVRAHAWLIQERSRRARADLDLASGSTPRTRVPVEQRVHSRTRRTRRQLLVVKVSGPRR